MTPSLPPPRLSMPDSAYFGFLSPPIDTGDASSDDGDTLQTPLTEHDEQHDPCGVYSHHSHHFTRDVFSPYAEKQQQHGGSATPLDLNPPTLSSSSSLSSLLAASPTQSLQHAQHDTFFSSFSTPSDALDLANASLEMSFAPNTYSNHSLDPHASPFTPAKQTFDFDIPSLFPPSPSAAASSMPDYLSPLPSFSSDTLSASPSTCDLPSLLLSSGLEPAPLPCSPRPTLPHSSTSPMLPTLGRAYSPRFHVSHTLNPFFVRTYTLGDELGAGGYGFVMTARHRTEGHEVAVKFIVKEKVPGHAWWEDPQVGRIPTEVMLLSLVDHPGIVKCLDLYEDEVYFYMVQELHGSPWVSKKKKKVKQVTAPGKLVVPPPSATPSLTPSPSCESTTESLPHTPPSVSIETVDAMFEPDSAQAGQNPAYIVPPDEYSLTLEIPFVNKEQFPEQAQQAFLQPPLPLPPQVRPRFSRRPSHDLFECIEQSKHKRLSESQARYVFAQVVDAVFYLDSQGITHCDIKDENLLVDSELRVKLIDFGSAVAVDPSLPRPLYTLFFGTTAYASSEILRKQPYRAPPAEVWTLGVLLSYLLTGHSPFPTEQDAIDGRIVLREPSAGRLSRAALAVMGRCLERDPERRADIAEVRGHRWLQGALERGGRE